MTGTPVAALAGPSRGGGTGCGAAPGRAGGPIAVELAGGGRVLARGVVNCAGLQADELARTAGEELVEVYPRKGEFLVFEQPPHSPLEEILLPVPSQAGKGMLVFPTVDGHVIAGPTARDRADKGDWSVEGDAAELILSRARAMFAPLVGAEPIAAYAGLRPAGRGANYVIERSARLPGLVHVAAIRSTGLSAAPAIGEYVVELLRAGGAIRPGPERGLPPPASAPGDQDEGSSRPWWMAAAERSRQAGGVGATGS
jgi:glycerol-3-phosphate dehydrogenase